MSVYIVFPEKRWVSDEIITDWFRDAIKDGVIVSAHPWKTAGIMEMALLLEDVGYITIGKPPNGEDRGQSQK